MYNSLLINPGHLPKFELCKRLTEIGFPETHLSWCHMGDTRYAPNDGDVQITDIPKHSPRRKEYMIAVCPSVMEMLDAIRAARRYLALREFSNQKEPHESLPNFLAKWVIEDYENNYLSFSE